MSYYNRYRNRRRQDNNNNSHGGNSANNGVGNVFLNNNNNGNNNNLLNNGGLQVPDAIFDLGKNKRVTVRQFRNINLIDIREYYQDSQTGELRPGKKGISLTEDLYDALLKHRLNIDEALRRFGSRRPRTKLVRLLSDDEYDSSDSDRKDQKDDRDKNREGDIIIGYDNEDSKDPNDDKPRESVSTKRERDYSDSEVIEQKKRKPAAATLLPYEESIENAKREANATLVVPGMGKQKDPSPAVKNDSDDTKKEEETVPKLATKDADDSTDKKDNNDSSAEEFAESLQAEMNKMGDGSSEEE